MTQEDPDVRRSRAASWPAWARALLVAAAVLLVGAAAGYGVAARDCTTVQTDETTSAPATSSSAGPAPSPGSTASTSTTSRTCARPGITAVPVVCLLLLAGLVVSPWLTKVTVGPISADIASGAPLRELAQEPRGASGAAVDPVAVGRARAAEGFLQGVTLPGAWESATFLFLLAPPDPVLFARKAPGADDLDDAASQAELDRVAEVVAAAADVPGQVVERVEHGRTDLAVATVNASKRTVAVLVASLADARQGADGSPPAVAVTGALLAAARGWSRVAVDLLLLDDDGPG